MNDRLRTIMLKALARESSNHLRYRTHAVPSRSDPFAYWLMPGGTLARLERLELDRQIEQVYEGEGECK